VSVLFERPGFWRVEYTDNRIFFVQILAKVTTSTDLDSFMVESRPHLERLAPVLYMNDATDVQVAPLPMQFRLATYMRTNARYIAKSAVFGLTPGKAFVVRSIVRAAGRDNVKVFTTRAECEAWLTS
jgi:hypothetical protein